MKKEYLINDLKSAKNLLIVIQRRLSEISPDVGSYKFLCHIDAAESNIKKAIALMGGSDEKMQ